MNQPKKLLVFSRLALFRLGTSSVSLFLRCLQQRGRFIRTVAAATMTTTTRLTLLHLHQKKGKPPLDACEAQRIH